MRATTEAAADIFDYGCDTRAPPALRENKVPEEKRGHRQRQEEHPNHALAVGEAGAAGEGPDRKAGHERCHSRNPPLHPVSAFQEISSYTHESHEVGADAGHQQQVTDKHNVIDYVN